MNCTHEKTRINVLPQGSKHYAKEECADCGRYIRFVPFPETLAKREENKRRLKILQGMPQDEWTKGFLATFPEKPSPKQQAVFDKKWEEQCK